MAHPNARASAAQLVYNSKREILRVRNPLGKDWYQVPAVSGGGRGQRLHVRGEWKDFPYGLDDERRNTGRFSNLGGAALVDGQGRKLLAGHEDPTGYGTIPDGLYEVGPPQYHDKSHGPCARLKPIQGIMMGRSGFLIHGQGKTGSEGCIVPLHGKVVWVLQWITALRSKGAVYLRVEGSTVYDIPDLRKDLAYS